jgi:hypothetical protein
MSDGRGAILRMAAHLLRAACDLEDDEVVDVGPAEPLRAMALAAVREHDKLRAELDAYRTEGGERMSSRKTDLDAGDDRPPQEGTDELSAHEQAERDLLCCAPPGQPTLILRESSAATPRSSSLVTHWERK